MLGLRIFSVWPFLCHFLQRLKQQEEEQEKEYNRLRLTQAKAGILAERSIERKKKEIEVDQADENRRLSAEQRAK